MDDDPTTSSIAQIKIMLRVAAAVVAHEGPAYLPLLERLKREYDSKRSNDSAEYAHQLLQELTD